MKIITTKGYAYDSAGYDVRVGDTVVLPPSDFRHSNWEDTVSKIGSFYRGNVKDIVSARRPNGQYVGKVGAKPLTDNAVNFSFLLDNASKVVIDGVTYVKKVTWVRV